MTTNALTLTKFEPKAVAEFGTSLMEGLVAAAAMADEAARLNEQATQGTQYLSFELTKALFDFDERFDDVDIHAIFSTKAKDVERFNTRVLVHMGVLERKIDKNDDITYAWKSEKIRSLYEYSQELKDKDPEENLKRFNNRKRLNMKLSEAAKAACALKDQGLKIDDLYYSEDPETKRLVPTIRNAPAAMAGDLKEVQLGSRTKVAGATLSPTMSSLIKLATQKHKPDDSKANDKKDKGDDRAGVAKIGISDEDFGAICNTVIRTVNAQENEFSAEAIKHLTNLQKFISDTLKKASEKKPEAKKPAKTEG